MAEVAAKREHHSRLTSEIDEVLQDILHRGRNRLTTYGSQMTHVWDLTVSCLGGGKMLRPRLLMDVFDALADDKRETFNQLAEERRRAAISIAAGVELLHFSFLIHDDLIDDDLTRRGKPNLMGSLLNEMSGAPQTPSDDREQQLHFVRSVGLLVGDQMLSAAHQVFARADLPQDSRLRLLDLLDHTVTESCVGEMKDVRLSDGILASGLVEALETTRLKTATYTFEFPLRAAAILADAPPYVERSLSRVGRDLGIAFQLQDDLLSAFGDHTVHGKDAYSDFREGKQTPLIAFARDTPQWPDIGTRFGAADFNFQDGTRTSALLRECGAEEFVRSMIGELFGHVTTIVSTHIVETHPHLARCVMDLAGSLEGRAS